MSITLNLTNTTTDESGKTVTTPKTAVITGGTRGIGYATAEKFLEAGANVVIFGSREETVKKALDSLKTSPAIKTVKATAKSAEKNTNAKSKTPRILGFWPNLTDEADLKNTFDEIVSKFGAIDIVVNNAGVASSTPLEDYTEKEYDQIADLNIKSVFTVSKVAVPYLKETRGVILNTSSMVSIHGQPSGVMYPASKFAVNGITKSLARELAKYGIRVNAVAPGVTDTDMIKGIAPEAVQYLISTIPLGRIGRPEDIANAFLFLASDLASYISGVVLSVDGLSRS